LQVEQLKPFNELTEPDERQRFFARFDPSVGDFRSLRPEDTYARIEDVHLHEGVPEAVRSHFATAQNLIAYSWFYYPFNVTAELLAYISVEFALKLRYPDNERALFKKLLRRAVEDGTVKSSGFSVVQAKERECQERSVFIEEGESVADYAATLVEAIPYLRNSLAHGSSTLHMHGASTLRTCAEFINQLFPEVEGGG
jgi:hypothetical protein